MRITRQLGFLPHMPIQTYMPQGHTGQGQLGHMTQFLPQRTAQMYIPPQGRSVTQDQLVGSHPTGQTLGMDTPGDQLDFKDDNMMYVGYGMAVLALSILIIGVLLLILKFMNCLKCQRCR
ncbi:hypothetical protein QYM36_013359 [Artemia franciscana]|uniref:Uncharacterized protein n=1 Tax=Artemia franciscana TaxID=6661 RepID=A0AA88HL55_ARTSF|nr:hypothetical protein QYM36_013359 [Artemia franciscana]